MDGLSPIQVMTMVFFRSCKKQERNFANIKISQIFRRYKDSRIIEDRLDKSFNENRGISAKHGTDGDGGPQVRFQSPQNVREFRSN